MHNCSNPEYSSFDCYPLDTATADGASSGGDSQQWQITYSAVPFGQSGVLNEYLATFASDYSVSWTDPKGGSLSGSTEYLSNLDTNAKSANDDETNVGLVPIQGDLAVSAADGGPTSDTDQYWVLTPAGDEWKIAPFGESGQCLTYVNDGAGQVPVIDPCRQGDKDQVWSIDATES